jgi:Druantia protein DruA
MLPMNETLVVQGRRLESADILRIRDLISGNPNWSRRRLSEALCAEWEWRNASGRIKDMAARSLLVKLQARGLIELPPRRQAASNRMLCRRISRQSWDTTPVVGRLADLGSLNVQEVSQESTARIRVAAALSEFHYLGYRGTVGENLQYTVTDAQDRLLACLLFGSAAWKCKPRDEYVGWNPEQRVRNLHLLTNNTRYLILPWIRVPHLSSWILGRVLRRLSADWQNKYGHPITLVETFVEQERFSGTSYKASNWLRLGSTTGRSRQDRRHTLRVPVKDVYLYPLDSGFRKELAA